MSLWDLKEEMLTYGQRLWQRGYVAANDGNMSVRLEVDRVLTTPTGVSKGFMTSKMLIVTDMQGKVVQGEGKPSSELKMHLEVYRQRGDINAVVHAHPPVATAFSVGMARVSGRAIPTSMQPLSPRTWAWT